MKCRKMCVCVCVCDVDRRTPHIYESNLFDQSFYISPVLQNRNFDLIFLSCHMLIIHTFGQLNSLILHQYRNVLTVVT
jgi:hypothetical protein